MNPRKPPVVSQGTIIVESEGDGFGFLVLFPDGDIRGVPTTEKAAQVARDWFKRNLTSGIGVGKIEWRGMEPG